MNTKHKFNRILDDSTSLGCHMSYSNQDSTTIIDITHPVKGEVLTVKGEDTDMVIALAYDLWSQAKALVLT